MNPETALILRDDHTRKVVFAAEAERLKDAALDGAALIGKVTNTEENALAFGAQAELHRIRSLVEKARKAAKEPVLEFGKLIDATAKDFLKELDEEHLRVTKLIADFQALEQAKLRAAERLRQQELDKIERDKLEALSKAKSHEQMEAVQAHFNEVAAQSSALSPVIPSARPEGQVIKTDWEISITNPYELARFHPGCVNITPRLTEIKQLLNEGITVKGVNAMKVTKASSRMTAAPRAIEA